MSRLYGTLQGSRGEATRCGHRTLTTHAAGWRGAIRVTVVATDDGKDHFVVELVPWRNSGGEARVLAAGLLDATWDGAAEALDRAMATTYRDEAECCQRCGRKGVPPCKCSDADQPEYRPDTAWGI